MIKPKEYICDICGHPLPARHFGNFVIPQIQEGYIMFIRRYVDYIGGGGVHSKVKLDICPECMEEMKEEVVKRLRQKEKK